MRRTLRGLRFGRLAAVVLIVFVFGGAALAYFSTRGHGNGEAAAGTVSAVSASPATAAAALRPGGSGELALTLSNPNGTPVHVSSLQLDTSRGTSGFSVDDDHVAVCTSPALTYTPQDNGGGGWDVPAKVGTTDGTLTLHLAGALSMGAGAGNGCQGASFTVYLHAGS